MQKLFGLLLFAMTAMIFTSCGKDETAPLITILSPVDLLEYSAGDSFDFTGNVTDDEELSEISFTGITGVDPITSFDSAMSHTFTFSLQVPEEATAGETNTLTVTAEDVAGNSNQETVIVEIVE